jgi:hypothetical protein
MHKAYGKLEVSGIATQAKIDEVVVPEAAPDTHISKEDAADQSETESIYSDISAVSDSRMLYLSEFVDELVKAVQPYGNDKYAIQNVVNVLPELLRTFALSLGHAHSTPMQRETMVFIHKYRRYDTLQLHTAYASTDQGTSLLSQKYRDGFRGVYC